MSNYYTYTITHPGLGRSRVLKAATRGELQAKADSQARIWNDLYAKQREATARRNDKAHKSLLLEQAQDEARQRTEQAEQILLGTRNALRSCLNRRISFSWDEKRNRLPYPVAQPEVFYHTFPRQPEPTDAEFDPHFGLLDKLVSPLHDKKAAEAQQKYQQALAAWESSCASLGQDNDRLEADYLARIAKWKADKQTYEQSQAAVNAALDLKQQRYAGGSSSEVIEYCTNILNRSPYPDFFEKNFDLEYNGVKRILVVNYDLPFLDDMPKLESVKYVKAKDNFAESILSAIETSQLYSSFAYQVCLRTLHELFDTDAAKVLNAVIFNGYVSATNPATGNVERTCTMTVNTKASALSSLNLAKVDPEECFKGLGGRSSEPLHKYRGVNPISTDDLAAADGSNSPAWVTDLKLRIARAEGTLILRVADLQQLVGSVPGARASLGDSRSLVGLLAEGAFAVEPDASLLAQSYRGTDAVALFQPDNVADLRASSAYQGGAAVLSMSGLVAVADGRLEPHEADLARQCIEEAFKLSAGDRRRFDALLKVLLTNGDCTWRALPKIANQLSTEFKEWAVEVAVYVGIKNGTLEAPERRTLDRIFQIIGLSAETEAKIIAKYTAGSPEVTVLHADPQPAGEPITAIPTGLKLDMSRVSNMARPIKAEFTSLTKIWVSALKGSTERGLECSF